MKPFQELDSFDSEKKIKKEINSALKLLKQFREKYPFKENPASIDTLTTEDVYAPGGDYFFRWIEFRLRTLGGYTIWGARVYQNVCDQIDDFKRLLRIAVSDEKTLAEKVDAPWERIPGMGGDKLIAKKIISCYDDIIIPVFKTDDLIEFINQFYDEPVLLSNFDEKSLGEKYQFLNQKLIEIKEKNLQTRTWNNPYFTRYLYQVYPPFRNPGKPSVTSEPLNKIGLLFSPESHDETIFLFSKLHEKIGFPYILKIQTIYPDIMALDKDKTPKRIEIETFASQFNHDPKGCDFIVCWENDLKEEKKDWPEIIELRNYL